MITIDDLRRLVVPKVIFSARPKDCPKSRKKYYHPDGTWHRKKVGAAMVYDNEDVPKALAMLGEAYPHLLITAVKV